MTASNRTGLCSVTLREQSTAEVLRLAAAAGLARIEWGSDHHAPPPVLHTTRAETERSLESLRALGEATHQAGLSVSSYGSYHRAGVSDPEEITTLLAAATALGAPRIRVWAGNQPTLPASASAVAHLATEAPATTETWVRVSRSLASLCDQAADRDLEVALEFHPNTLTDTAAGTRELLERADRANLSSYWQPQPGQPAEAALADLKSLSTKVSAVHVFSWWPTIERLRLSARADLWEPALAYVARQLPEADLLLEFVPHDDPALLAPEAQTLRRWVEQH